MRDVVFAKTEAGKAELTRRGNVPQRLRTLLVMIDGVQPAGKFIDAMQGVGVAENAFADLEKLGLIERVRQAAAAAPAPATAAPAAAPIAISDKAREQLHELRAFFNETVRDAIGLRGFTLQLKVERASTLEDYRGLRDAYIAAVRKNKGDVIADAFAARLDMLLKG